MTSEHVTITEEVQKDGQLITQTRETLQTTVETPEQIAGRQAMGVTHPDYIPATERVYTYNEDTGMSESKPREEAEELPSNDEPVGDGSVDPTPAKPVDPDFQPMSTEDDKPTTRRK